MADDLYDLGAVDDGGVDLGGVHDISNPSKGAVSSAYQNGWDELADKSLLANAAQGIMNTPKAVITGAKNAVPWLYDSAHAAGNASAKSLVQIMAGAGRMIGETEKKMSAPGRPLYEHAMRNDAIRAKAWDDYNKMYDDTTPKGHGVAEFIGGAAPWIAGGEAVGGAPIVQKLSSAPEALLNLANKLPKNIASKADDIIASGKKLYNEHKLIRYPTNVTKHAGKGAIAGAGMGLVDYQPDKSFADQVDQDSKAGAIINPSIAGIGHFLSWKPPTNILPTMEKLNAKLKEQGARLFPHEATGLAADEKAFATKRKGYFANDFQEMEHGEKKLATQKITKEVAPKGYEGVELVDKPFIEQVKKDAVGKMDLVVKAKSFKVSPRDEAVLNNILKDATGVYAEQPAVMRKLQRNHDAILGLRQSDSMNTKRGKAIEAIKNQIQRQIDSLGDKDKVQTALLIKQKNQLGQIAARSLSKTERAQYRGGRKQYAIISDIEDNLDPRGFVQPEKLTNVTRATIPVADTFAQRVERNRKALGSTLGDTNSTTLDTLLGKRYLPSFMSSPIEKLLMENYMRGTTRGWGVSPYFRPEDVSPLNRMILNSTVPHTNQ